MVMYAGPPETDEEWLRSSLRSAQDTRAIADRRVRRLTALLQGPVVMVEAHWMRYGGHEVDAYYSIEEAATRLGQMYEDGTGWPLGITIAGMPIPWTDSSGEEHEPDPTDLYFERERRG